MNEFLKTRSQIDSCTHWLIKNDYMNHPISCKDWELYHSISNLGNNDLVDLGADGSFVLHNAIKEGYSGRKVGIDLIEVTGSNKAEGAEYFQGDLMHTPFEDESFDMVVSLSTIEHQVDYVNFATEVSRILRTEGVLILSFDYWPVKPDTSKTKLYSLDWNILDTIDVQILIAVLKYKGLYIDGEIDWSTRDAVINPQYCSPAQGVSYTFGIFKFIKR